MTGSQTLAARLALGVAAGAAGVLLSSLRAIHKPGPDRFRRGLLLAFLCSRLILFGLVFLVFRVAPRGDIPGFYLPEALAALQGRLPYRDFASSYAPLHSYVDAAVLLAWRSPLALILFAIAVEFLLLWLWLRLGKQIAGENQLRVAAVLYLTSALSLQFVAIDGQDNVLVALLVLLSVWLAMRSEVVRSGIVAALPVVAVKLIPLFYAPVFFAGLRRRWAWVLGFLIVIAVGYGSFALLRLPVLQPLTIEGPMKSAGTLPFLFESLTGLSLPVKFWDGWMLLALAAVYAVVWKRSSAGGASAEAHSTSQTHALVWGLASATLVLILFANKSWPAYLMLILFPLCLPVAASGVWARSAFALFSAVALVEHSYWATLLSQATASEFHRALAAGDRAFFRLLLLELLLLAGYLWLLSKCVMRLLDGGPADLGSGAEPAQAPSRLRSGTGSTTP